jgi:hypothetical protein
LGSNEYVRRDGGQARLFNMSCQPGASALRGQDELQRIKIEDNTSQVRFSKLRTGLFKKAFEIALLWDIEVTLLVFSPGGKLY